jgi:hypothetical protein
MKTNLEIKLALNCLVTKIIDTDMLSPEDGTLWAARLLSEKIGMQIPELAMSGGTGGADEIQH